MTKLTAIGKPMKSIAKTRPVHSIVLPGSSRRMALSGHAVTPKNVRVTQCPSATHDQRYQIDPDAWIEGEYMAEWRRLRGAK